MFVKSTEFQFSLPLGEPTKPHTEQGFLYFGKAAIGMLAPLARVAAPVTPPLSPMGGTFRTKNNQNRVAKNAS